MNGNRPYVPRLAVLAAAVVIAAGVTVFAVTAGAADPGSGTVSADAPNLTWNGKHYDSGMTRTPESNTSMLPCAAPGDELCDHFKLTVDADSSHWDSYRGGVEVKIAWESEQNDFDLHVYDSSGELVGTSANGSTSSERVFIENASGEYDVQVVPFRVTDSAYEGGAWFESRAFVNRGDVPAEPLSDVACGADGFAGPFPCKGVDLESFLPPDSIGGGELNDIWGWTDPETKREYALVGKTSGTAFVDITDSKSPVFLGELPSHQPVETLFASWRDVKVYKDHAFIVSEEPTHGMQVFDLTRLRDVTEEQEWDEDAHYSFVLDGTESFVDSPSDRILNPPDNAHNIAINEESGFAYAIGTHTCGGGGPHMIDINEPTEPKFAGCVSEDGYTHDTQCVNYRESDPDPQFAGREICLNSNEDSLTVVDVTDKENPEQLARVPYEAASYTHQGWLTEDRKQFLIDDELDEQDQGGQTKTYVFNVENLRNPIHIGTYNGAAESIDHNQYVKGNRSFQANYRSGLRVLDVSRAGEGSLSEVGFFDVYPADDKPEFNGAWSNYPYFESGVVIVSGIEQGLFVLRPSPDVAGRGGEDPPGEDPPGEDPPGEDPPGEDPPGGDPPADDGRGQSADTPRGGSRAQETPAAGRPGTTGGDAKPKARRASVRIRARRVQRLRRPYLTVSVSSASGGRVLAGGTLSVPGASKVYRVKSARKTLTAGGKARLRLRLSRRAFVAARRALRDGRRVRARLSAKLTPVEGTPAATRRSVRLKR